MSGASLKKTRPFHVLRAILGPIVTPVYGAVVARKNRRFDRGIGVRRVPVPVVSVGNLTLGGTGKTPFVMWLCCELRRRGFKPAIAMRGYRSKQSGGRSDEAEEYRNAMPDVPVIVNPDRYEGITAFLAEGKACDVVVLDDGFQHRQLHRDLDIVLVNAKAGTPGDRLFPSGSLREPYENIRRAGVIVLTHAGEQGPLPALPGQVTATSQHGWAGARVMEAGLSTTRPSDWLKGQRIFLLCGIANPHGLFDICRSIGAEPVGHIFLRDHQLFSAAVITRAVRAVRETKADALLITQKDVGRLAKMPAEWADITVVCPNLVMRVNPAAAVIDRVIDAVRGAGGAGGAGATA